MINITKEQRDYLVSNGVSCGENGISKTHGKHTNYYLCESRYNLSLLEKYKDSITICSVE